ncbi:hypothetical protein IW262DRAFT_1294819 [Armillaria fumosa]|nr:hypothetical protein IW262DRAFT_1294819 [Armillaria fumosa]
MYETPICDLPFRLTLGLVNKARALVVGDEEGERFSVVVSHGLRRRAGTTGLSSAGKRASSRFEMALRRNDWTEIWSGERDEESHASMPSKAPIVSTSIRSG